MVERERLVDDVLGQMRRGTFALFAGAGLSVPAGFVDWKGLLRPLARAIDLDVDREHDLMALAQYHITRHGRSRAALNRAVLEHFARRDAQLSDNHRILARLPIDTFWTTNYDTLLETALAEAGRTPDVKHCAAHFARSRFGRDVTLYKMHGDVSDPAAAVLCRDDFERYHRTRAPFLAALSADLMAKTFLFLGFSFNDPNLNHTLGRLRLDYDPAYHRTHFCLLRRERARPGDRDGDLAYRLARQRLFIEDLAARYRIDTLLIDDYAEVTAVLDAIDRRYRRRAVFVGGAVTEYDAAGGSGTALRLLNGVGALLANEGYRIVSGLGSGVSGPVIDGALRDICHRQRRPVRDDIVVRPLIAGDHRLPPWRAYREEMLDYAGVALFLYGTKETATGRRTLSDGLAEEFELAVAKGLQVLPLGCSGGMSRLLWQRVAADLKRYHPEATPEFVAAFRRLGRDDIGWREVLAALRSALRELARMTPAPPGLWNECQQKAPARELDGG